MKRRRRFVRAGRSISNGSQGLRQRPWLLDQVSWTWLRVRWCSCGEALDVGPVVRSAGGRDEQVSWQQTGDNGSVPGNAGPECPGCVADDAVVGRLLATGFAEPCLERAVAGREGAQQIVVRGVRQRQRDPPPCHQQEDRHPAARRPIEPAEPCHLHLRVIAEGPWVKPSDRAKVRRSSRLLVTTGGDRQRTAHAAHLRGIERPHERHEPRLLDGLDMIEVHG